MENKTFFRGAIVGGYNKDDVHRCIQELKKVTEEELLTNEEIVNELNVQMEEQKNEFEAVLEERKNELEVSLSEQKIQYENLIANQKVQYETELEEQKAQYENTLANQKREFETQIESQKQEVDSTLGVKLSEVEMKVEEANQKSAELQNQCDIWYAKYEELNAKYDELSSQYEVKLSEEVQLREDLKEYYGRKDVLFKYEIDSRARADQLVEDAKVEAEERLRKAEDEAIQMVQDSKGRIDNYMTKYVAICDDYREQTHESTLMALELQQQLEAVVMQVVENNNEIKNKLSALCQNTEKGIEIFQDEAEESV